MAVIESGMASWVLMSADSMERLPRGLPAKAIQASSSGGYLVVVEGEEKDSIVNLKSSTRFSSPEKAIEQAQKIVKQNGLKVSVLSPRSARIGRQDVRPVLLALKPERARQSDDTTITDLPVPGKTLDEAELSEVLGALKSFRIVEVAMLSGDGLGTGQRAVLTLRIPSREAIVEAIKQQLASMVPEQIAAKVSIVESEELSEGVAVGGLAFVVPDTFEHSEQLDERSTHVITQRGNEWCVVSKSGKDLGCYATRDEALKRLGQIEFFKRN